ncbi:serine hydrolase domain-containing protein [Streptomyces uncialis]|uniref:serine hydrolase domain-containing protein n=1 Tax=Streptomyces uncialis TaxID=1048205 RepID=UPI00386F76C3|nr:beta-lactamase family protein [Streptomyces uncialis]
MATRSWARTGAVGIAAAAVAASAFTAPAAAHGDGRGHEGTQRALDGIVRAGIPGVTGQVSDKHGVWKGASGVGNLRTGAPRGKDDRFRIASITKTFVATVLLQQENEGLLRLDDKVERWLPGLVRGNGHDGRDITVRQLLNHTSGVFDYLGDPDYQRDYMFAPNYMKNRLKDRTPRAAVAVAMKHAPTFRPGTGYSYSNTNYVLAALVMEKAGGRSYEREVRTRIIKPLGLRGTVMPGTTSHLPNPSSRSYSKLSPEPTATKVYDVTLQNGSQSWADGDMISSAADLNRFLKALLGGEVLPAKQLKAMKTLVPDPDDPATGYGLGLAKFNTTCGVELWGHSGGWLGSLSLAVTTEDGGHALSYNLNGDWTGEGMAEVVEAEFCGQRPPARGTGKQSYADPRGAALR